MITISPSEALVVVIGIFAAFGVAAYISANILFKDEK
jgi:hypothetical protein